MAAPPHRVSAQTRNRRLAYVARLEQQGYFTEDAMRQRAPLLYDTYVGHFVAGQEAQEVEHSLSAELLRRSDNADADARLRRDLQRLAAVEVDSDSSSDEHEEAGGAAANKREDRCDDGSSHEERVEEFRGLMVSRFIGGMDAGIDYDAVDADEKLDAAWQAVKDQDAEDAYFADD